jgi:membrane fusion protein, multidrug efflux system
MDDQNERTPRTGWLMPFLVIGGLAGGWALWKSGPVSQPEEKTRAAKMVRTLVPQLETRRISLTVHGELIPARRVVMEPEVRGRIVRQHPLLIPGGRIVKGEELFGVDDTLSKLDVRGAEAAVKRAAADLSEAKRQQAEAKRLSDEEITSKTELAARDAEVAIEQAEMEQLEATRDRASELLLRHSVKAPFNALVTEEAVENGQQVNPGFAAATLVGADEFWVRVAVPMNQLQWIRLPRDGQPGATARVILETGGDQPAVRTGTVIRLLGDLERTGRMARVLVSIDDPLGQKQAGKSVPFLLGSYVRVEIDAGELQDVLTIQRSALRDGDRIWVADAQGELQIREAKVRWQQDETVFIDNALQAGDALIVSQLRVALPGMKVHAQPAGGDQ